MKKAITMLILLVCLTGIAHALLTYDQDYYIKNKRSILSGSSNDPLYNFIGEVDDVLSGTDGVDFLLYTPTTAPATAAKGQLYFDLASSNLKYYTTSWQTVAASTSSTLDEAYDGGQGITVDGGAVTLTTTDAANNAALAIVHVETGAYPAFSISNAGTDPTIEITTSGTGADITGTSATWSVAKTGVATLVGATIGNSDLVFTEPTTNDVTLLADGDAILTISATSKEDLDINLATANTLTLTSSTGVDKVVWGSLDAHSGLASLAGDAGADFAISVANTGTYNLTVSQTGTGDNELRLASAGTATNAIALAAATGGVTVTTGSGANGDFLVTTGDDVLITAGDDFEVTSTAGTLYKLAVDDTAADTITIGSAKDTTAVTGVAVTIGSAAGASATTIQSGTGDLALTSTDDITLTTNTAATDAIVITNTPGTADNAIVILASAGGLDVDATKSIVLTSAEATGDAIQLTTSNAAGGIDITSGTGDLALVSTDDITLTVNTGVGDAIVLTNTPGTATGAIAITATAGGITHTSANVASTWTHTADGAADDFTFALAGAVDSSLILTSSGTGEDALSLLASGTSASANSILVDTADGGITLTADGASKGDITIDAADDVTITAVGKTVFNLGAEASTYQGNLLPATQLKQTVTTGSLSTAHCGYCNQVAVDAQTITLPATAAGVEFWIMCTAADGVALVTLELDNADKFVGAGITPADGEAILLTQATQNYGDYIKVSAHTDGWIITEIVGTWAEASP